MDRRKGALKILAGAALGVLSAAVFGQAFAQGMGMGTGGSMMGGGTMMGPGGGVSWPDTLEVVTVSGVASSAENYIHDRYTLDIDADGSADYQLSFGPWWYAPESGATRPENGASVTITGGLYPIAAELPLLVAFEIDGRPWREPEELLPWSGGWMHENADTTFFHTPLDSLTWMGFPAGAMDDLREHMAAMMGGVTPDSAYFHFETADPDSLPGWMGMPGMAGSTMVAGYHLGFSDPWGNDLMGDELGMGFNHDIEMHLHYDVQGTGMGDLSGHDLVMMALDKDGEWVAVPEADVDMDGHTVSSTSRHLSAYYALVARRLSLTAVEEQTQNQTPTGFALWANYPNPFNASTTIRYQLPRKEWVTLEIVNLRGQSVRTLADGPRKAGYAAVHWDGKDAAGRAVASGVYLYRLKAGEQVAIRKLLLLQ